MLRRGHHFFSHLDSWWIGYQPISARDSSALDCVSAPKLHYATETRKNIKMSQPISARDSSALDSVSAPKLHYVTETRKNVKMSSPSPLLQIRLRKFSVTGAPESIPYGTRG